MLGPPRLLLKVLRVVHKRVCKVVGIAGALALRGAAPGLPVRVLRVALLSLLLVVRLAGLFGVRVASRLKKPELELFAQPDAFRTPPASSAGSASASGSIASAASAAASSWRRRSLR